MSTKPREKSPPSTEQELSAYRCQLHCKIGKDALDKNDVPSGQVKLDYVLYAILNALENLSKITYNPDK